MQLCGLARLYHEVQPQWRGRHTALQVLRVQRPAAAAVDGAGLSPLFAQ